MARGNRGQGSTKTKKSKLQQKPVKKGRKPANKSTKLVRRSG